MANRQNTLLLKRSNIIGKIPPLSGLTLGEMALNTADAKLYSLYTSGSPSPSEVRQIGWDRISRTGDTVFGDFAISGSSLPSGYALSVTGDTNFVGDIYVEGDIDYDGNLVVSGSAVFQSGITANTIYTDYIDFNTGATVPQSVGRVSWDSGTGTLNIAVGDSGTGLIDLQVGQEEIVRVFNDEATTLQKGEIVYVSGSNGNRPRVKRAQATSDGYSVTTLGMVDRNIASGDEGYVTTFGIISNLNTLGLTGGTPVWLSGTVPGGYTSTKPIAPLHTVLIGYVVRVSATVGSIFVNISNGWELDEIHDVRISAATEGDLLMRSSFSGTPLWVNTKTLNGSYTITGNTNIGGNLTVSGTTFLQGLSATTISATTIGTSGDCIDDIYVSNIHSCSPLNINPLDEGNVYFGSNSGITVDLANERLGVGTDSPQYPLQVVGTNSEFYYDPTSTGGRFNIFSSTGIPRFDVTIAFNSFVQPATGGSVGMRSWTDTIFPGYGGNGDMFLYAGANTRNLNIINAPSGSVPLDNIRFYAGTTPDLSTAHMFIDGNGSSKGFIGLGLETPSEKLHVSGNTRITGNVRIGGPNNTYSSLIPGLSVGPNNELGIYSETASIENNIQLRTGSAGSNIRLYNGTTSPSLNTRLTQYSNYSALEANFSTGSTNATLFIVNESDGPIIFRTSGTDDTLYLLPSGDTTSVFSGTNEPVVYVVNYLEAENIALRSVGTSAFVNDIRIDATGKLTTNTSDERLKENIKPITGGLDTILQLSGVTYQWKDRKAGGNDERFGFIAQQVESVEPRLSFTNKVDQYKGVHTDAMIPLLVEAIKEQQVVIDELKNRISALENLNN